MKDRWEEHIFQMAEQEELLLPQRMSDRIEEILCKPKVRHFHMNFRKSIVLAAALVMLLSATAVASVGALKSRMEAMNREKLEAYFAQIYDTKLGVDNYNRPFTDGEKERLAQLQEAYENEARFPEGELTMIEDADDYRDRGVAFLGNSSTFFFPAGEMSDEELLCIIDFRYKRDYSLQKMNELIAAGEAQLPQTEAPQIEATAGAVLDSDAVYEPAQALTIPYTGSLALDRVIAAGRAELYLAGRNSVHRMAIGSSDSQVFFDDFGVETQVLAMCQNEGGDLYMALWQWQETEDMADDGTVTLALWVVDAAGKLVRQIDLAPYLDPDRRAYIGRMAVDGQGYLYLNTVGMRQARPGQECEILVLDAAGDYVTRIASDAYALRRLGGLGVGRDGRVYTYIEDYYDPENLKNRMGIASLDVDGGTLGDIYFDLMPENAIMIDLIAPGTASDFVFWGYDGIFTYDLGDTRAVNVMPVYEAPCALEGARVCALPDGRIVLADASEHRSEETPYGQKYYAVPEKTCFYYVPGMKTE